MATYEEIVEAAFADKNNTAIALPNSKVNEIIRKSYDTDEPFTYTRTQLWDMEDKKAHHPDKYLGYIIRPGSLKIFDERREGNVEYFTRVTDQRRWKDFAEFTTVIERVCVDHDTRRAFFLGTGTAETPTGEKIVAGDKQALFHVEHSVVGSEDEPENVWRIVHLTDSPDAELLEFFKKMGESPYLREFNEVYIREDLGKRLDRK